jgi:hypothetical protein
MKLFAKVIDNIVVEVISAEQEVIDTGLFGPIEQFIETSYNTRGGIHYDANGQPDGGIALRANYAGIGYVYDKSNDVFYPPRPSANNQIWNSWTIGDPDWTWKPPVELPSDSGKDSGPGTPVKRYEWDESTLSWKDTTPILTPIAIAALKAKESTT